MLFLVWIVDHMRAGTLTTSHVWIASVATVLGIAAQFAIWYAANRIAWITGFIATGEARATTLSHIQQLPLGTLREKSTGHVTATFSTDFAMVSQYITEALPALFGAIRLPLFVVCA